MALLVQRRTKPDSASLNPVCLVSHLNGRDASVPRWDPVIKNPLASLLSTPHPSTLKENKIHNDLLATNLGTKRMTCLSSSWVLRHENERSSPDERAPAMPALGAFCAVVLANDKGVEFGAGAIR
jgi:hypothetical protein